MTETGSGIGKMTGKEIPVETAGKIRKKTAGKDAGRAAEKDGPAQFPDGFITIRELNRKSGR